MIEIRDIEYSYQKQKQIKFPDWSLSHGQHGVIYGNSGSGKSTLIGLISGLLEVQTGFLSVCDETLKILTSRERDSFRGKNIGMVFQKPFLNPVLNVYDNLAYALQFAGKDEDPSRILDVLQEVNLADKAFEKTTVLTNLEARNVSVARAIIHGPKLILVDEPINGLDMESGIQVIELLTSQALKYEASLVIATSDIRIKDNFKHHINLKN